MLTIAPAPAREQMGRRRLAEHERGRDVEVERALERADARIEERGGHRAARVVHDDVEPPELAHGLLHQRCEGVVLVHVARNDDGLAAHGPYVGRDLVELFLGARRDRHVGAGLGVGARDRGADAPAGTGHDRDLAVEAEGVEHRAHVRYRETVSTMAAGLSAPSRSIVIRVVACTPPGTSLASRISPRPRRREPTGTGDGKRTLSAP